MGVFEQKFKVGDRVRRVEPSIWPNDFGVVGEEYTVLDIVEDTGSLVIFEGCKGASQSAFELVEQPWQPKVGDRVQRVKGYNPGSNIGHIATVLEVEDISAYDDEGPWLKFTDGTSGYASSFEPLPVAAEAQPAALKIEAGRYYKTRDGRKVGPVAQKSGYMEAGGYHYSNTGECCFLGQSGDDTYPEFDLIAEWVDEPAVAPTAPVAATASNDNAAVASQRAYKVGDKVRSLVDWCDTTVGDILSVESVKAYGVWAIDKTGDETYLSFDEIEPAPQQSTAGFTIPLVEDEPAAAKDGSTQLTVRITSDFTELHEQIDYAFERLKKLKKKARKLGIELDFEKAA
ncbi:hypothetical protein HAAEEKHM_00066 [Sinorhizobium phage AP-16-3]|nr:hypothetical protein HAAEEKHM_00066 [Sinorhizobium phage AP-16-3]